MRVTYSTARLVAAGMMTVLSSAAPTEPQASRRIGIVAARILDPVTGVYSGPSVVVASGGRITAVVTRAQFKSEMVDSIVDLQDQTILPGLIDAHVHLAIGGAPVANAQADLRAGFTTIVDLGSRTHRLLQIRDSINRGELPGPRVLAAGIWVGVKNGVCEFNGIGIAGGAEEFQARIRANAAAGAEVTKLCISGWPADAFVKPMEFEMPPDVIRASVAEAHAHRQLAVAHDISLGGVRAALDAGIDGLAHAAFLDSAAARRMAESDVFMIPTLASLTAGDTSPAAPALVVAVALAYRSKVTLVFGTDGGVLPHGQNAEEFMALARAGVSPLDAIRAATVNAARAFRLQDSVGVIRVGMSADIVAVRGDPLRDLRVLGSPTFVMSRGKISFF